MTNIALFGGTGFVGQAIQKLLRKKNIRFSVLSRNAPPEGTAIDISDYESFSRITGVFTAVVICSSKLPQAVYTDVDLDAFVDVNVKGIHNILRWAKDKGITSIVYCSTLSMLTTNGNKDEEALADITSHAFYKITKFAGEHLVMAFCRQHQINCSVLRIARVYGPGMPDGVIQKIVNKMERQEVFVVDNDRFTADFIHVDDVAKAIVICVEVPAPLRIMNVASSRRVSLPQLVEMIKGINKKALTIQVNGSVETGQTEHGNKKLFNLVGTLIPLEEGLKTIIAN